MAHRLHEPPRPIARPDRRLNSPRLPASTPATRSSPGSRLALDSEKAAKVLELHQHVRAAEDAQLAAMHQRWQQTSQSDSELGGEGDDGLGRYERSVADARLLANSGRRNSVA